MNISNKKSRKIKPLISALEPRILFDGAAVATAVDALDNSAFESSLLDKNTTPAAVEPLSRDRNEVVFVDSSVENYETIVDGLGADVEVFIIDSETGGLEQIAAILEGKDEIDAIHIISHGSVGEISLGSSLLNVQNIDNSSAALESISNSLSESGDILLYGCNVASDGRGQEFINKIAASTQADVAASEDITGAAALGGDWDLEVKTGIIETKGIVIDSYEGKLASSIIMNNGFVKTAISQDGTLGIGGTGKPGIQYDADGGGDDFLDSADYLTPGAPQELFSVKHAGILETNNNSNYTRPSMETTISGSSSQVVAVSTTADGKLEITQIYSLPEGAKVLTINVTIKNISASTVADVKYLRSTDPDVDSNGLAGSTSSTNNTRGTGVYSANDFVLSEGPVSGRVIGLYSSSSVTHNTSISGWTKDPDVALAGGNVGNGDKTIDLGFNIGSLAAGSSSSFNFLYVFANTISQAEAQIATADSNTAPTASAIPTQNLQEDFSSYTIDLKNHFSDSETNSADLNYNYSGGDNTVISIDNNGIATITAKTSNWYGVDHVTFTASDSYGLSASQEVTFNVSSVNDTPTVSNSAELKLQTIQEDVTSINNKGTSIDALFDPVFNDVDNPDSLGSVKVVTIDADPATEGVYEYSPDNGISWATVIVGANLNDTDKIRFNPVANYFGTPGVIEVKVRDQGFGTGGILASTNTATLSVVVVSVNDIPVITSAQGVATITETSADDVPSDVSLLTSGALTLTGTLTGTDVEDDGASTALTYAIQGGTLSGSTYTLQGKYGVLTLDTSTKNWTYLPNKQVALNALADGDTDTDTFMFKIIDSSGAQANQSLDITLVGTNDLPEVSQVISDQTFSGNGNWIYQIPANTFLDREGDGLAYTVEQVDNAGTQVGDGSLPSGVTFDEASRKFIGDGDFIVNGDFYFKVTATDPASASISDTFQVTFTDVENNAPVVVNPIDRVVIDLATAGTAATFYTIPQDTFSDDHDNSTALIYSATGLPAGMSFDPLTREFSSDGSLLIAGKYIIDITATDLGTDGSVGVDVDKSTTTQFAIYVDDGTPNTISADTTIADQTWTGSGNHIFKIPSDAFIFDDVAETVAYTATADASALPSWLTLDATTGVLSGNPPHDAAVTYAIIITATESGQSSSGTNSFTLTIATPNDAPAINGTTVAADQLITEGNDFSYNFGELFIDPDGGSDGTPDLATLTYSAKVWDGSTWGDAPAWLSVTGTTISGTPIGNVSYLDIKLIATDSGGATNETTFKLDLQDPAATTTVGAYTANNPGVVTVAGTPTEGQTLTVLSITDPDGDGSIANTTYQWQVSSDSGATWTDISNATNINYTLTNNEASKQVRAKVFYTDGGDVAEVQESTALSILNVDDTGAVNLSGTLASGDVINATITDSDGLVGVEPMYAWYRSNNNTGPGTIITGATGSSYTLTNDDGNKYIRVVVSYTDNQGTANTPEAISAAPIQLGAVAPVAINDANNITESGGLNNTTLGDQIISGNLFANDTDQNPIDTQTLVEVRVGSIEGAGSGVVISADTIYSIDGSYGTLTISDQTGAYSYTLNETNVYIEGLNVGNTLTESFNYTITDSTNRNDIAVLNITINGSDDKLILTTDTESSDLVEAGGINNAEAGTNKASITFTAIDVDNEVTFDLDSTWVQESDIQKYTKSTDYGSILFDVSTGVMTYTISNDVSKVQSLRPTDSVEEIISIKAVSLAASDEVTKEIKFIINGSNDTPNIQIVDVSTTLAEGGSLSDTGSITFTDVDLADRPTATEVTKSVTAVAEDGITALVLTAAQTVDIEAAFSIVNTGTNTNNGEVTWDYTIDDEKLDFLANAEVVTAIFTITVTDDAGATASQDVTITIGSINDQPVIDSITATGALTELDGTESGTTEVSAIGTMTLSDLDDTDTVTLSEVFNNDMAWSDGTITANQLSPTQIQSLIDGFVFDNTGALAIDDTTNTVNSSWTYTTADNLNFLANGETLTFSYTVTATDDSGVALNAASATKTVTVTITGTNDQPIIESITTTGAFTEKNGTSVGSNETSATGSIQLSDLDDTDTVTLSEIYNGDMAWSGGSITTEQLNTTQVQSLINGFVFDDTGALAIDDTTNTVNSAWTYTTADDLNFLAEGETLTFSYTVTATDDSGVVLTEASATQTVTITITGTNDAPVIQIVDVAGDILEGTTLTDSGSVTFTDVDLTDNPVATEATATVTALNQGGTTALALTATQRADIEAAFTINNTSTNTNDGEVTWDYTITEGKLDFLGEGEIVTAVFTITVTDDEGVTDTQDVTITIIGTNDTPTIQIVEVAGNILEGTTLTDSGSVTFTDVDLTDSPVATEATATVTALNQDGTTALTLSETQRADIEAGFTINNTETNSNDGEVTWDYTITEAKLDFLAEGEVVTVIFTLTVTDDEGATTTQDVVITLTGSNDKTIASTENIDALEQSFGTGFTMDISTQFSDIDLTDEITFTISGLPKGLTYDQGTGVISGSLNDIGSFAIVISADDGEEVTTKTFELEILAPAEVVTPTVEVVVAETSEVVEQSVEIASGSSGKNLIQDTSENSTVSNLLDNIDSVSTPKVGSLEDVSSSIDLGQDVKESGAEGLVRSVDITVTVDANGQVSFDDTVESIDFKLKSISFMSDTITIDIRDDYRSDQEVYSGSYNDGKGLPSGLNINRLTGQISGVISEEMLDEEGNIEFEIIAYNESTNETRILKVKLNISEIKNAVTPTAEVVYIPLNDQLVMQSDNINNYGNELSKLFVV
ncbi:MAG: DUF4347 domain-containing protein [Colwellia sp.]|nr:DUF4347 domain-containing protein [Colwellia sp.]